jgi:hypothetical protein
MGSISAFTDLLFYVPLKRFFHLYGDVTITGEGLQNLGLFLALWAFEQGGIFIVDHTCCDTGSWFLWSHPMDYPHSVASYNTQGDTEDLC